MQNLTIQTNLNQNALESLANFILSLDPLAKIDMKKKIKQQNSIPLNEIDEFKNFDLDEDEKKQIIKNIKEESGLDVSNYLN
ncbi:MAG: hypothetical protein CR967_00155 [Proteobacteria bacterium]|nr:MAG: hypothetical protein CR967_00155 [Pseudomonadota bacterium]